MTARVVVVGGGFAGVAAALSARARGAAVGLVRGRAGASVLSCGAHDLAGWNVPAGDREPLAGDVRELLAHASAPIVVEDARVVAGSGTLRTARARDVQVLAIGAEVRSIAVPRMPIGVWDADAIAASLNEQLRPLAGGARAIAATLLHHRDEERMPLADLAARHDQGARVDWLVEQLHEALAAAAGSFDAILLPPMLGIAPGTIERVRGAMPIAIGEALGEPGGAAAMRFVRWTEIALTAAGIEVLDGEVTHVSSAGVQLRCADGSSRAAPASAVVLAIGGVGAGGLTFGTGEHDEGGALPAGARPAIRLSITVGRGSGAAPLVAWCDGAPLLAASSLFGVDGDRLLLGSDPALLRAGLAIDERCNVLDLAGLPIAWLYAAGDVVAGRARTSLRAIDSGARAGKAAAGLLEPTPPAKS